MHKLIYSLWFLRNHGKQNKQQHMKIETSRVVEKENRGVSDKPYNHIPETSRA
jgi:hypothetical protein